MVARGTLTPTKLNMNTTPNSEPGLRGKHLRLIPLVLLLQSSLVHGQLTAPSADESDVVELSPFTVSSGNDTGYEASRTLSGTRLNTENRYVGSAITEVTGQLLNDLAINNFEDVLSYVPNSAPAESGGLSADPTGNESIFGVRYRVRGFLLTGFSRDFFKTRVAPDSYNTDRMSFSRGPNSVLFGIGEPGGVTNAVSSRAGFTDTNQVGVRFDTWDSTRFSASFNRVLVDKKLAVKVAAVTNDKRNHRNPWHNQSDRFYGALTFKPFPNTTLRVNLESGDAERINARSWAPSDGISVWRDAGSQPIPASLLNTTAGNQRSTPAQRAALGMREIRPGAWSVMTIGDVAATTFYQPQWELMPEQNNVPGFAEASNGGISFRDDSILPQTANVLGTGNKLVQDFDSSSVFLEQKLADNLYLELAFNKQDTNNKPDFSTGARDYVYIDLLPTVRSVSPVNPTALNGTIVTNPNFGRYFTFNDTPTTFNQDYNDETARAMMSYELDARRFFDGFLGTLLGRHNFAGMYEQYKEASIDRNYQLRNAKRPPNSQRYDLGTSWVGLQNYIDIEGGNYDVPNIAELYPRIWADNASDIPDDTADPVSPMWLGTNGTNTISETNSRMFAMQNYFWENRVVTTFGWRTDEVDSWSIIRTLDPVTGLRSDVSRQDPKSAPKRSSKGDTSTKGIVITPLPWLGLFYNESNNFRPANADQLDIFGRNLSFEEGEGKDYGIKLHLFDGKLTGSFGWFETSFQNQSTRGPRVGPVGSFDQPRSTSFAAIQDYYDGLGTPQLADRWNERGYFNTDAYFATQDFAAEGWEASFTANPTDNWRITVNFSKQENTSDNVAPAMREWAKFIRAELTDPVLLALETNTPKPNGLGFNTIAENLDLIDQRVVEIASLEGFADQRQPELSANLVTAYDFREGALKNFGVGGSYRWRGKSAVGYALNPDGSGALDATRPYWSSSTSWIGAFVSYRTVLFGKIRTRLQLNIDNLLDDDDPNVLLARESNGQRVDSRWSLPEGRSFALSADFEF